MLVQIYGARGQELLNIKPLGSRGKDFLKLRSVGARGKVCLKFKQFSLLPEARGKGQGKLKNIYWGQE